MNLRNEKDQIMRLKLGAMGLSIVVGMLLTMTTVLQTPIGSIAIGA